MGPDSLDLKHTSRLPAEAEARVRDLRRALAPHERRLWARLRSSQLRGFKFRRQHPIGRYIVDFCCPSTKLVLELDGDSHVEQQDYDRQRTAYLEARGYRVIRIANRDVERNIAGVLESVLAACQSVTSVRKETEG